MDLRPALADCSRTDNEGDLTGRCRPRQPKVERPRAGGHAAGLAHELAARDGGLVGSDSDCRVDRAAAGQQVDAWEPGPCATHLLGYRYASTRFPEAGGISPSVSTANRHWTRASCDVDCWRIETSVQQGQPLRMTIGQI